MRGCAVVGVPSERWGETVHAVIVLKDGAQMTEQELISHCRGLIGGYKRHPVTGTRQGVIGVTALLLPRPDLRLRRTLR